MLGQLLMMVKKMAQVCVVLVRVKNKDKKKIKHINKK